MVNPNPPLARIVSQLISSSDKLPSLWLWVFVSGDRNSLFDISFPQGNVSVSNILLIKFLAPKVATAF
jgi:hypothetical protein